MGAVLIIFLVICSNSYSYASKDNINNKEELIAVVVIYRHGDRAPLTSFPNDHYYNLTYWPMGFGELTKQGIQRQYKLGQWFRQRYNNFLQKIYSPREIIVESTEKDRALMSASATLAGLYPPIDFQLWNTQLKWQPIPIHIGYETKIMDLPCAKYDKLNKEIIELIDKDMKKKYSNIYRYIEDNSGWTNMSVKTVSTLRSVMYAYKNYNLSFIPEWVLKINHSALDEIAGIKYSIATATPTTARLKVGTFYDHIFNYLDKFTNPTLAKTTPKFLMMASHDTTIASILNGMELYEKRPVGFGDTFIMELKKKREVFFLNLFYKSEYDLEKLIFRDCEFNCLYSTLKIKLKDVTIDKNAREKECCL
ncbi:prostatic acid phosphatase-like isoform X1 [Diorhabda carinulata]|uniref:prostatic acid phosphatase-like isoform X1 n=2 Tax=Diorhabda carinulata TaxID=1163345 RepID=UPI0025A1A4E7|nr:prostatic acid phosphatase-like isoform X1 [Diorhabda carinulata]